MKFRSYILFWLIFHPSLFCSSVPISDFTYFIFKDNSAEEKVFHKHIPPKYWTVSASLQTPKNQQQTAFFQLHRTESQKKERKRHIIRALTTYVPGRTEKYWDEIAVSFLKNVTDVKTSLWINVYRNCDSGKLRSSDQKLCAKTLRGYLQHKNCLETEPADEGLNTMCAPQNLPEQSCHTGTAPWHVKRDLPLCFCCPSSSKSPDRLHLPMGSLGTSTHWFPYSSQEPKLQLLFQTFSW